MAARASEHGQEETRRPGKTASVTITNPPLFNGLRDKLKPSVRLPGSAKKVRRVKTRRESQQSDSILRIGTRLR